MKSLMRKKWAREFKENHLCERCPFVINHVDVGVGFGIVDCDHVCAMEESEIVEYMKKMEGR